VKKIFTCVVCPIGCEHTVEYDENNIISDNVKVSGNTCPRGEKYAKTEIVSPERTLTSTVKTNSTELPMLPVKTDAPIPKGKMFEAMKQLNKISVSVPVNAGDVIAADFITKGVNLVSCRTIKK